MRRERYLFLQEKYNLLFALLKRDERLFENCKHSLERICQLPLKGVGISRSLRIHDESTVEICCELNGDKMTHSYISDMLYIANLVETTWNNMAQKKQQ